MDMVRNQRKGKNKKNKNKKKQKKKNSDKQGVEGEDKWVGMKQKQWDGRKGTGR